MRPRLVVAVAGAALTLAGCGSAAGEIAADACSELEGARVFEVGGILGRALDDADEAGVSGPELGDAMREQCPAEMAAVTSLSEDEAEREALPDQVELELVECRSGEGGGPTGTVTNTGDVAIDVWVEVDYLDDSDVVLDQGLASVRSLRPGVTAEWTATGGYDLDGLSQCHASVGDVYES